MELTHEMAGIFISLVGAMFVVLAAPLPRQVSRWHVHGIDTIEPEMLAWLARAIGVALFILGLVTLANTG